MPKSVAVPALARVLVREAREGVHAMLPATPPARSKRSRAGARDAPAARRRVAVAGRLQERAASSEAELGACSRRRTERARRSCIEHGDRARAHARRRRHDQHRVERDADVRRARSCARSLQKTAAERLETLALAHDLATEAIKQAPQNARWPGYVAEIHVALAEADPKGAAAHWKRGAGSARTARVERGGLPLLAAPLLARARAQR